MFILKLSLEVAVLAILFFLVRKSLKKLFPQRQSEPVRGNSLLVQRVQAFIFLITGVVFSGIVYWLLYSGFYLAHNFSSSHGALVINHFALVVPALIIGFYLSTMLNMSICEFLGIGTGTGTGSAAISKSTGGSQVLRYLFSVFTLSPALLLLVLQFNVYIKINDGKIYQRNMAGEQKTYHLSEITRVSMESSSFVDIYFEDGAMMRTKGYSGNLNDFLDNISR